MDKIEVLNKIHQYRLLLKEHLDLDTVYLYGSYVKGSQHEDSDIDVAVVVNRIQGDYFDTLPLLWKLRRRIDDRIEPVLIEKNNDRSGFLKEIMKNGIEIND